MWSFAGIALAVAGATMLLTSGISHVRNHRPLLASLLAHSLLPYRLARLAAHTLPAVQVAVGTCGLAILAVPASANDVTRWIAAAGCVLYGGMTGYLTLLWVTRDAAQCACFGTAQSVTWFSSIRTAAPAVAFGALALRPEAVLAGVSAASLTIGVCLALVAMFAPRFAPTSQRRIETYSRGQVDLRG